MRPSSKVHLLSNAEALAVIQKHSETHQNHLSFLEKVQEYSSSPLSQENTSRTKKTLQEMKLTTFEAIQLINIIPESILSLQLIIEDMDDRFTEDKLEQILRLFRHEEL
ncbi:putative RNA polymerase [Ordospora pajunii]|uniref:putative RNA polymerase n=1 Tax=Ordospora pajunii TaxID=3039483 RepID=UPI0029527593|nr:putative RNA polymerase [Ordospora pajunii]KAH9412249.1 putative RNA polymerase [Ordospora pajunii]